jgi:hypothetical protein
MTLERGNSAEPERFNYRTVKLPSQVRRLTAIIGNDN